MESVGCLENRQINRLSSQNLITSNRARDVNRELGLITGSMC